MGTIEELEPMLGEPEADIVEYNPSVIFSKPEHRVELAKELSEEIDTALKAKSDLHDSMRGWNDFYEGVKAPKSDPWPGCANIHIPMTRWMIDTTAANICRTILGTDPIVRIEPRGGEDEEPGRNWQAWLQYLSERRLGLKGKLKEIVTATLKHGKGLGKLTIDRKFQYVKQIKGDSVEERQIENKGPRLDFVELRDFVMVPAESRTISEAVGVGDRRYVYLDWVRQKEALGVFDEGTYDEVKEAPGVSVPQTETVDRIGVKANEHTGKAFVRLEHWEYIRSLPLRWTDKGFVYDPDKGEMRDCLLDLLMVAGSGSDTGESSGQGSIIARCILYPWIHGRRHYIPFTANPREGQFYGKSWCELLKDLNDEMDTEHNMRLDWGAMVLRRPLVMEPGVKITDSHGNTNIKMAPGAILLCDDPTAMKFLEVPPTPPSSEREEMLLLDYGERATSVTAQKVGKTESGRKTLGEVELVESQGNVRFDDMVDSIQGTSDYEDGSGIKELFYQLMGLTMQFADEGQPFRVLNEELQLQMPSDMEEVIGAYDFIPQGNSSTSNINRQKEEAVLLYRELMQNPLVLMNPNLQYNITKNFLLRYGEKNWQEMIGKQQEAAQAWLQEMMANQHGIPAEQAAGGGGGAEYGAGQAGAVAAPQAGY